MCHLMADNICIYKAIEQQNYLIAITNMHETEKLFKQKTLDKLKALGFEPIKPAEYEAKRTVVVRGLDDFYDEMTDEELFALINGREKKVEKIIRVPSRSKIMKFVCCTAGIAENMVSEGIDIGIQMLGKRNLSMEEHIRPVMCMRCYAYGHSMKACEKNKTYTICSVCASPGHRFDKCRSNQPRCINCDQDHATMAYRCPKRKEQVQQIIKKKKDSEKEKTQEQTISAVDKAIMDKISLLPDNFVEVIATAMMHAAAEEKKSPGCYNFVYNEILQENKMKTVKIPASILKMDDRLPPLLRDKRTRRLMESEFSTDVDTQDETDASADKRPRHYTSPESMLTEIPTERSFKPAASKQLWSAEIESETEGEMREAPAPPTRSSEKKKKKKRESIGGFHIKSTVIGGVEMIVPDLRHPLTPSSSAATSPEKPRQTDREDGAYGLDSRAQELPIETRRQSWTTDCQIRIIAPENRLLPKMTNEQIGKELKRGKLIKYMIKEDLDDETREDIFSGRMDLSRIKVQYINLQAFKNVTNGQRVRQTQ